MRILRQVVDGLLDLVYPLACYACGTLCSTYICDSCISLIEPVADPYCVICGHTMKADVCNNCLSRDQVFTKARAAGNYDGVLKELVHELKYKGARCLADPLSAFMLDYLNKTGEFDMQEIDCLIPVPIHAIRKRIRGYNQSELLADGVSHLSQIPVLHNAIRRNIYTTPQVELSREMRMRNMKSAFQVIKPDMVTGKRIMLIDDVSTTSSTIHECAGTLIDSGASEVFAFCLAFDY
ncbi:MAG: double zinc ribbon domain-containing protein [Armatimonadota bacterium]